MAHFARKPVFTSTVWTHFKHGLVRVSSCVWVIRLFSHLSFLLYVVHHTLAEYFIDEFCSTPIKVARACQTVGLWQSKILQAWRRFEACFCFETGDSGMARVTVMTPSHRILGEINMRVECLTKPCFICGKPIAGGNSYCPDCKLCICFTCVMKLIRV